MSNAETVKTWADTHLASGPIAAHAAGTSHVRQALDALVSRLDAGADTVVETATRWCRQMGHGPLGAHPPAYRQLSDALPALVSALGTPPAPGPAPVDASEPDADTPAKAPPPRKPGAPKAAPKA